MLSKTFSALVKAPSVCGRVTAHNRNLYNVDTDDGAISAQLLGTFRYLSTEQSDLPVVGDYVSVKVESGQAMIESVLPRLNLFARRAIDGSHQMQPIAANLDTLFVTVAVNRDFNLRRLQRYAIAAIAYGVPYAIALTKIDLVDDVPAFLRQVQSIVGAAPVIALSSFSREGLDSLSSFCGADRTIAFVGSSGVGKSTLINTLLEREVLAVNAVRCSDDRGRHTTTNRLLLYLADGTAIIDTPGMREFALADAQAGIEATFDDVAQLAMYCRFNDCKHGDEPGCAVREQVDENRLTSWRKLGREAAFEARKSDPRAAAAERNKWKAIHKENRRRQR